MNLNFKNYLFLLFKYTTILGFLIIICIKYINIYQNLCILININILQIQINYILNKIILLIN